MDNILNFGGQPSPHVQPRQSSAVQHTAYGQHTACPYVAQQAQQAQQASFSTNVSGTSGGQMYSNVYINPRSTASDMMPISQLNYPGVAAAPILPAPYHHPQPYQQSFQHRGHYSGTGYPAYNHRPNGMYQVLQPGAPQSWIQTQPNSTLLNETPGSSSSPSQAIPGQAQNPAGRYSYSTYGAAYTGSPATAPGQTPTVAPAPITPAQQSSTHAAFFSLPAQSTTAVQVSRTATSTAGPSTTAPVSPESSHFTFRDQGPNQASLADGSWSTNFIVAQQEQQMHRQQEQEMVRLEREQIRELGHDQPYQAQLVARYRQMERVQSEQQSRLSARRRQAGQLQGSVSRSSTRVHPWGQSPLPGSSRSQRHTATSSATRQDSPHRQGPERRITGAGVLDAHEIHPLALGSLRVRRHDSGAALPHLHRRAGHNLPSGHNPLSLTPGAVAMTTRALVEDRTRAAQLLRGAMVTQRVASKGAIASLESVDIESLSEDKKMCVICYNDFGVPNPEGVNEAPLRLPKCKHVFGDHCIKKWFNQSDSCPYCRDKLPSQTVSRASTNTRAVEQYVQASEQLRALHSDYQSELRAMMTNAGMPFSPSPSPSQSPEPGLSASVSPEPASPVYPPSVNANANVASVSPHPSPPPTSAESSTAVPSLVPENGESSNSYAATLPPLSPTRASSTNARRGPSEALEDDRRRRRRNSATHPSTLTLQPPVTSNSASVIPLPQPLAQDQPRQSQQPQQPQPLSAMSGNSFLNTPYSYFTSRVGLGQGSSIGGSVSMYQVSPASSHVLPPPLQLGHTYQQHVVHGTINNHSNLPHFGQHQLG
ncbi:zinc finger protein atl6 [Ophiostoma piceae UAMH 11346]|uniref:Zinc finger protein atl6 n=1 Tax=Ophiostoma piceae (strain UAMH 11346) TaxID=1262450 RepID=S3CZS1_OPHP1|nr:zinc finger protein atl6 [Ophiostoma piceae UAMH 11346]